MVALSSGTNIIIAQSGVTIAAPDTSFIPAAGTYSNQSVTYNLSICNIEFYIMAAISKYQYRNKNLSKYILKITSFIFISNIFRFVNSNINEKKCIIMYLKQYICKLFIINFNSLASPLLIFKYCQKLWTY